MGDIVEVSLWHNHPTTAYRITSSAFTFEVKSQRNVTITLLSDLKRRNSFMITLSGDGHNVSTTNQNNTLLNFNTPNLINSNDFTKLWITWFENRVDIGRDGVKKPLIHVPCDTSQFQYITFAPPDSTQSNPIYLKFALPPPRPQEKGVHFENGQAEWKAGVDQLPSGALIGGFDKEPLYIIRAQHNGSLTPGMFVPSEGVGYIPWGGDAHDKEEFEVLCGYNFQWVRTSQSMIPVGAIEGGHAEETQEPLFVGRAYHDGCLIPGKVQPSHKVCYIPFKGREIAHPKFEVLVNILELRNILRYSLPPLFPEILGFFRDDSSNVNRRQIAQHWDWLY